MQERRVEILKKGVSPSQVAADASCCKSGPSPLRPPSPSPSR